MNTKIWAYIKSVNPRRFLIVDEKMGIVFGFFMFNHPGTVLVSRRAWHRENRHAAVCKKAVQRRSG